MALAIVLFALVVVGLLVAIIFAGATLEARSGRQLQAATQALGAADAGADAFVAAWDPFINDDMPVGSTAQVAAGVIGNGVLHTDTLTRLSDVLFLLRAFGERRDAGGGMLARRTVGRLLRLTPPLPDARAALTTISGVQLAGADPISGTDTVPAGWGGVCPPPGPPLSGVRDSSGMVTQALPCGGSPCVTGAPPVLSDSTVGTLTLTQLGPATFANLWSSATRSTGGTVSGIGPVVSGLPAQCDLTPSLNWGSPADSTNPCFRFFPLIAAQGGTILGAGQGQGVLLVDGDLELAGGFEFFGTIIVRGVLRTSGVGGRVVGAVLAQRAVLSGSGLAVTFSSCAVRRARLGAALPEPLTDRNWIQIF